MKTVEVGLEVQTEFVGLEVQIEFAGLEVQTEFAALTWTIQKVIGSPELHQCMPWTRQLLGCRMMLLVSITIPSGLSLQAILQCPVKGLKLLIIQIRWLLLSRAGHLILPQIPGQLDLLYNNVHLFMFGLLVISPLHLLLDQELIILLFWVHLMVVLKRGTVLGIREELIGTLMPLLIEVSSMGLSEIGIHRLRDLGQVTFLFHFTIKLAVIHLELSIISGNNIQVHPCLEDWGLQ
jgi:hypothetical protein